MKTVQFKVIHRLLLLSLLNEFGKKPSHSLQELNRLMKVLDKVDFADDERKVYNLRVEDGSMKWNSKKDALPEGEDVDVEKSFELSDEQYDLVKDLFTKKNEAKEFTVDNVKFMIELAAQFEVTVA